jgi:DNA polymerase
MSTVVRDLESRSVIELPDVGADIYSRHPSTEVMTYGYRIDDGPVKVWHPDREPLPKELRNGITTWVAHNAQFEMAIERNILVPKYGFPVIPIERQVCTMAQLNALALPGGLDKAAKALNLEHQKDMAGARLMKQMAKPRKPKKGEDPNGIYWVDTPEKREQLDGYCIHDVLATYDIHTQLPGLSEEEYLVWLLDQSINDRGFYLDRELAQAAAKIAAEMKPRINDELTKITNGVITAFTQVPSITKWVKQHIDSKTMRKSEIELLLARPNLPAHVRRVLELRLLGAQAAVAKVGALLQRRCDDGRIRGSFVYHAAGPGRWSSRGAQVHNLKRPLTKDLEHAVEVIGTGDLDLALKEYKNPLAVIGDCIRSMIIATPGHTLIGGDFSGIEARVTAWIACEESKLEVFRKYDAGTGPDPYIIAAALILDMDPQVIVDGLKNGDPQATEWRHIGKGAELAFGFQGGVNAYIRFLPGGTSITDAGLNWEDEHGELDSSKAFSGVSNLTVQQIEQIKNKWRAAHPNIVKLWHSLKRAIEHAVDFDYPRDDPAIVRDRIKIWVEDESGWKFMKIELPSGRLLSYPHVRYGRSREIKKSKFVTFGTEYGQEGVVFKDNASGAWGDVRMYGGLATENIVQAIARDLLAQAMMRINAAGYKIVAHVHDECVIEVPTKDVKRIKPIFTELMMQLPDWAEGLPVMVKSWSAKRYAK